MPTVRRSDAGTRCLAEIPPDVSPALKQEVQVDGRAVALLLAEGRGRPVLFIHGNSASKAVWSHQMALARQHGRTAPALDLPGHGNSASSATPEKTYSFPGYAAVVSGLLDTFGWTDVDVVGWSLGGHVGLQLLAVEPRLHALLVVGTPPIRLSPDALRDAFYADDKMQLAGKGEFTDSDVLTYGKAMFGTEKIAPHLLNDIRRTDGNARKFMFLNALNGHGADQRAVVESSAKPLCVVHGQHDPFIRLAYLRALKYRALWTNRIHVIAGTGHAPHWERPSAFNEILSQFLKFAPHPN